VSVLVETVVLDPDVKLFAIFHVAEPLNVNGKSNTLVAVSTVYVDVLPINVVTAVPAVYVPPVERV